MNLTGVVEGILFVVGDEGITLSDLSETLGISVDETKAILKELQNEYEKDTRGIRISFLGDASLIPFHDGYDEYIEAKKLCDKLIERIKGKIKKDNIDTTSFKKDDGWAKYRYYGYQWYYNNLWFGIYHCPIRGLRFYFAAANTAGVDKSFTFCYLVPIGKYFDKEYRYFMLKQNPTLDDLENAATEFCNYTKSQNETLADFFQLENNSA